MGQQRCKQGCRGREIGPFVGGRESQLNPSQPIDKIEAGINFVRVPRGSVEGSDVQSHHSPLPPFLLFPSPPFPSLPSLPPRFRVGLLFWFVVERD